MESSFLSANASPLEPPNQELRPSQTVVLHSNDQAGRYGISSFGSNVDVESAWLALGKAVNRRDGSFKDPA
jgi:hypothetical protein